MLELPCRTMPYGPDVYAVSNDVSSEYDLTSNFSGKIKITENWSRRRLNRPLDNFEVSEIVTPL